MVEETARGDATSEKFSLGKPDHEGAENVLHLLVSEGFRDHGQRLDGLLAHDSFVLLGKLLKERQKQGLVILELPI